MRGAETHNGEVLLDLGSLCRCGHFQFGMLESQPVKTSSIESPNLPRPRVHQLPPTVASLCIMKSATEAASFSQPPSNASLMTPSDYRLWQLSLNSGQAARSQANEEVEEAWGYVASGAGE